MFSSYAQHKLPSEDVRNFYLMSDLGFITFIVDPHSLLFSLCKYGFVSESEQLFLEIKSQFGITNQTYTILISLRGRDQKRALKLFDEMLQQKLVPDLPCYNAIIVALCRAGELALAHEWLKEMKQKHKLEPNAATY
jgi:pentatricopeptide repeat protein